MGMAKAWPRLMSRWTPPPNAVKTSFYLDEAMLHRAKVEAAKDRLSLRGWLVALIEAEFRRRDAKGRAA
jgi:hypothetical protein